MLSKLFLNIAFPPLKLILSLPCEKQSPDHYDSSVTFLHSVGSLPSVHCRLLSYHCSGWSLGVLSPAPQVPHMFWLLKFLFVVGTVLKSTRYVWYCRLICNFLGMGFSSWCTAGSLLFEREDHWDCCPVPQQEGTLEI